MFFFLKPFIWFAKLVFLIIFVALRVFVVNGVQVFLASNVPSNPAEVQPAAAIVVLGSQAKAGAASTDFANRLAEAAALFRAHRAPVVVVASTSLPAPGQRSEAAQGEAALVAAGVPGRSVDQAVASNPAAALQEAGTVAALAPNAQVIVVTDPLDALWTRATGGGYALHVVVAPPVGSQQGTGGKLGSIWEPSLAVALGRAIGFSRTAFLIS